MRHSVIPCLAVLLLFASASDGQTLYWPRSGAPVVRAQGLQRNPLCISDGNGGACVAWEDVGAGATRIALQRLDVTGARLWDTSGVAVTQGSGSKSLGNLVADGGGGVFVCWWEKRGTQDYDVYAQHLDGAGTVRWTAGGVQVTAAPGDQLLCDIADDTHGGVFLCWEDRRSSGDADVYAQHLNASGLPQWEANGRNLSATAGDQLFPSMIADASGGVIVVWTDKRHDEDVFAQRLDFLGNAMWGAGGMAVTNLPSVQTRPRIVSAGQSQSLVFWEDRRDGASSDIWYQKLGADGKPLFPVNGAPLTKGKNNQTNLDVTADGLGGAIAAWTDFRGGSVADIYARRVDANGYAAWKIGGADSANGLAVCTSADTQELPCVLPDGQGGAFFAWQDKRNGADLDLYMQAFYQNSTMRYPANGAILVRAENSQLGVRGISSAPGTFICVWSDGRSADGSADIYAQRIGITALKPDSVNFDSTMYANERMQPVTLRNQGTDTLFVTSLGITGGQSSDFIITDQPALPFPILPLDSAQLRVKFVPRDKGYRFTSLRAVYTIAGSQQYVQLSGYGLLPSLGSFPTRIDYGARKAGVAFDSTLRGILKNNGFGTLTVSTMRIDGANAASFEVVNAPSLPLLLRANDSIPLILRFTPHSSAGEFAYLTFMSDGASPVRAIYLNGTGVYPTGTFAPATLRFDSSNGNTLTKTVLVKQGGAVALRILGASIEGANPKDFTLSLTTPYTLSKGDSLSIPVHFAALANGPRSAYVKLVTDMFSPLILVPLNGSGVRIATSAEEAPVPARLFIGQPYPNPASISMHRVLTFPLKRVDADAAAAQQTFSLYDALGRKVAAIEGSASASSLRIPLEGLLPGIYRVSMDGSGAAPAKAIIVK